MTRHPAVRFSRSLVLVLALLAALTVPHRASAREAREQARIDFLLHTVETSKVVFIRNGSEHDGPAAASHLRMKLNYAGERLKTAEQFITYCASQSSITHRRYQVRLADGKTVDAASYFEEKLRGFDQKQ